MVCYLFAFQLYDRSPEVVRIAYATKVQLDVEHGVVDDVAIFNVKSRLFSFAFVVAYALHHTLGHWDFKISDHEIKDLVLVKFKNQSSISLVHGCNLKLGEGTEAEALMMATKVSELMPRTPELYTLTRTVILPVPRHPFEHENDEGDAGGDAGGDARGAAGGDTRGSGDAGAIVAA